ncbi:S-layer homology domain-containing protein [Synechocystis salina]|uniref:S-layer homology domain-containing protein n=1 Tax=Synechocystis salina LEGE 00031 TaxID=1828736 RepID=A0ABR9VQ39_9SYNC|nr:S-layer homology domain-containing protein [Synechocystis salina]MBE9240897.1 S-layer homology domain-containing protein [Synechocystis salina LEGE 00041]MBE9252593.1 S-layer homology domain-containing protein [Synechocystis salina LEGE 00031]
MVQKSSSFFPHLIIGLCALLGACSGNQALQDRFAANPSLGSSPNTTTPVSPTPTPQPTEPDSTTTPTPTPTATFSTGTFSDLEKVGDRQRAEIEDLSQLGIVQAKTGQEFAPQSNISRGEFARWLFQANNVFFANQPSKQIRPASSNTTPLFTDVPPSHPDFAQIQGLADAGLIPSSLTNDPSATQFRPGAPLTREDVVRWKVPLDYRRALPNASLENIKETWGFQDAAKISPNIWPALAADFQNGDQSNLKRMFGYITIFQPQRPVTREEAASALWFLGAQADGLSAKDVINAPAAPSPAVEPEPTVTPENSPN